MKALFPILLSLSAAPLFAQWQVITLPLDNAEDLRGFSLLSSQEFYICSNTEIAKTTNGGQTWQVTALNANFPNNLYFANTVREGERRALRSDCLSAGLCTLAQRNVHVYGSAERRDPSAPTGSPCTFIPAKPAGMPPIPV